MKKMFFLLSVVFSMMNFALEKSTVVSNVKWKWVDILNKDIKNGNNVFGIIHYGVNRQRVHYMNNICGVGEDSRGEHFENKIEVIGTLADGDEILEYTREGVAYGTSCPSGVFFKGKITDFQQ